MLRRSFLAAAPTLVLAACGKKQADPAMLESNAAKAAEFMAKTA